MNEAEIVDRFLRDRQRFELMGGVLIVVKADGKLATADKIFLSIGGGPGIDNVIYKDLDEVEKYLPDIEKSRTIHLGVPN